MPLLEEARAVLDTGQVCDACLGRPFARRSFGLTNAERGRALRTTVALADDEPYELADECWVCEGTSARYAELADRAATALEGVELDTYEVGTRLPPLLEENDRLLFDEAGLDPEAGEALNRECNREVGRRLGERIDAEVDFDRPHAQVLLDLDADTVEVHRNSAAIYGRYRKLERGIPQTSWDTYETSVEELVAPPAVAAYRASGAVFHGAGREDVDALMVGTGRPFVLEIEQPRRRHVDLADLGAEINEHAAGRVAVDDLAHASHEMIERVKELDASKVYRAEVTFEAPVDADDLAAACESLAGATLEQRTPHRVDHRRADTVREREVYDVEAEHEGDRHATLEIDAEGGLYVKELVSGDDGRTEPSLAGLVDVDAEVTALDVVAVEGEEEPFADPDVLLE